MFSWARGRRRWLLLALVWLPAVSASASAGPAGGDATCTAAEGCGAGAPAAASPHYYWPSARGRPESPGHSPYKGPRNLTASLAFVWRHPEGQYRVTSTSGPLIDDRKNIYLSSSDEIWSLDSDGNARWIYASSEARFSDNPSIWNGRLHYVQTSSPGILGALDMDTGQSLWRLELPQGIGNDLAATAVYEGRVFASAGLSDIGGCASVVCVNASDGSKLWEARPDTPLWNFLPTFPGDGTMVFQTQNGDPYSLRIDDGTVLWKYRREEEGWTDGGTAVADGVAYVAHAHGPIWKLSPTQKSDLTAYRLSDGKQLWRHAYATPPNSWPVAAPLGESRRPTVLFPYGGQSIQSVVLMACGNLFGLCENVGFFKALHATNLRLGRWGKYVFKYLFWIRNLMYPWPGGVTAFEPESGEVRWEWQAPDWWMTEAKGDDSGLLDRSYWKYVVGVATGTQCLPNPWASPVVTADGTVYLGFQDGVLYALRERAGEGQVVDSFETSAAFQHPGIAMAPGMLAVTNCDSLYVFKYDQEEP